jgi:uncharacterized RDD family membrane protein YckC
MGNDIIPVKIEGIKSIYAGFWLRLGSFILDTIILMPIHILLLQFSEADAYHYLYVSIAVFVIYFSIDFFFLKRYSGTPGVLILRLRIIKLNGFRIGWREIILRYSVLFFLHLASIILIYTSVLKSNNNEYITYNWMARSTYITSLNAKVFNIFHWIQMAWVWNEFVVIFFDKRRRAIYDYLGGTVLVKAKYLKNIHDIMNNEGYFENDDWDTTDIIDGNI